MQSAKNNQRDLEQQQKNWMTHATRSWVISNLQYCNGTMTNRPMEQ